MIPRLAEEIYERSIQLKKYNSKNLLFKKNRLALIKDLYAIQELNNDILHKLYGETDYSIEHQELALFMNKTLSRVLRQKCFQKLSIRSVSPLRVAKNSLKNRFSQNLF